MSHRNLWISACALLALFAASANADILVTKTSGSGHVPSEWVRVETCKVYPNEVVVTQRFGSDARLGFTVTERRAVQIAASVQKVLDTAKGEKVKETENMMCDGPHTMVTAGGQSDGTDSTELFRTGGCGSPRQEREGPASRMLRELVNQYCPNTHDFDRE